MPRSTRYYARWFLQYTRYFTYEYLAEENGKHEWFLPPNHMLFYPRKLTEEKGKH
jgi:hypothetical protein